MGGVVSMHLWRELRAERELTAQLRAGMEELRAGRAFQPATTRFPAPDVQPGDGTEQVPVPAQQGNVAPAGSVNQVAAALAASILDQRELMKDPEYRKAQLAQLRLSLRQNYPGLVEELGLSAEEADRLFTLLAESQAEMSNATLAVGPDGTTDPVEMEAANRRMQELQQQQELQLQAMLGSRYPQWEAYQKTRNSRMQAASLARTFESVGTPATPEQSRVLATLFAAEQEWQRQEIESRQPATPGGFRDRAQLLEARLNAQIESNRRLLDAARPHLNARQLETMQATLDQQVAISRASFRMAVQQQAAQGQGSSLPATGAVIQAMPAAVSP